jgi:hypothetical protein
MKGFLTAASFARLIEKDPKTVVNWIKQNRIRNVKRVGRNYQIPIEEVGVFNKSDVYPPENTQ